MPDWREAGDYEFTKGLDRRGWAWEFMRRNSQYRRDHEALSRARARLPGSGPLLPGPSAAQGLVVERLAHRLGAKWGQMGPLADPAVDRLPAFLTVYPLEPRFEDLEGLYDESSPGAPLQQCPEWATLTFDVRRPIGPQIKRARAHLEQRRKAVTPIRPVSKGYRQWPTYLRLLDALAEGESTNEIIDGIEAYRHLGRGIEDKYQAADRVSDHRKRAEALVADPLGIIV